MTKILFVCHGNICRSPMAQFLLKDMAARRGIADQFEIDSAATSTEEIGNPVHPGTRTKLKQAGIDCSGKTARQFTKADYAHFDYIIGMDRENMRNLERMTGGDPLHKVHKLMEFTGSSRDVADPWYTGDFDATWRDVQDGCEALLNKLCKPQNGLFSPSAPEAPAQ